MKRKNVQMCSLRWLLSVFIFITFIPGLSFGKSEQLEIPELFQQVNESVVLIYAFGRDNSKPNAKESNVEKGIGSGVVISDDGLIMTASHVVHIADRVIVKFLNGHSTEAEIISSVPHADLGLLKLKDIPDNLSVARLGDSGTVRAGDQIFVIGAPYGIDHTLTIGYVSGRLNSNSMVQNLVSSEIIQIDAAVNPGNSGGPVFNMEGQVIGIVSHILSQSGGFEGLGFSVSINTAKELLLQNNPFWSGVEFLLVKDELASALNIPQEAGFLIQRVAYGSPADKSGLKPGDVVAVINKKKVILGGDIILGINGLKISEEITQSGPKFKAFQDLTRENKLKLKVLRQGQIIDIEMIK